ncbi:hypothetical protein chiPu_0019469 [Chiloscyllium punctatum]|uniref:Myb-like domain-containing protein n=1 Tax=Chiloscyllium punctatum TaxID=137246 RepID=A0A401RRY9_CHIPU|nr:hypothetical protein [Chiloscyllium punctatum]
MELSGQVKHKTTAQDKGKQGEAQIYPGKRDWSTTYICEYILRRRKKKKRRKRKNFTEEEVGYLLDGVRKMGNHWNSILWSYPFQKGRTNVDLSRKYRTLQKGNSPRKV